MKNSTAINQYLKEQASLDLLRFITCGSVDDGKSTLIGRMLYESQMIFDDQVASLKKDSQKHAIRPLFGPQHGSQNDENMGKSDPKNDIEIKLCFLIIFVQFQLQDGGPEPNI